MTKTAFCVQEDVSFLSAGRYLERCLFPAKRSGTSPLLTATMCNAMRLIVLFLFAATLTVSAKSFSQNITLTAKEQSLKKLFSSVEQQTGYVFFYNAQLLENTSPVTISVVNMPLGEFLQTALKDQPLHFRIEGKTITLSRKALAAVLDVSRSAGTPADTTRQVSGLVTSEDGNPIAGASIVVKGTSRGTSTNNKGSFSIPASAGQTLVVTAVGYEQTEVRLGANDRLSIKMNLAVTEMKGQVITGIYQRKKESFTGSSATFTTKELKTIGNQSPLQALKTLDPSFAIIENTSFGSDPNRLPDIEIRGKSSVIGLTEQYGTNPNQPLFILDGFETTLQIISDFSMDRIESITVLKDAAATAIYGSKAANGVVVVETKRPTAGRLHLNYNVNTTLSFPDFSDYNLMNAEEKLEFEKLSGFLGSTRPDGSFVTDVGDAKYNSRLAEIKRGVNSYWLNEPVRNALAHRHTLTAEGGDAYLRYSATLSLGDNQGVMKGSSRKLTNGNVRLIYRNGSVSVSNNLSIDLVNATRESIPFSAFSRASPYYRKFNNTGGINQILEQFNYGSIVSGIATEIYFNPLYDFYNKNVNRSESQGFTNNFELEWRIVNELRARMRAGINRTSIRSEVFRSPFNSEFYGTDPLRRGLYNEQNERQINYDGDLSLTYGKLLGGKHMVNAVAGMRLNQVSSGAGSYEVSGFVGDDFPNASFAYDYSDTRRAGYQEAKKRSASYFVNGSYGFDERFIVEGTLRADGASVFGASRQFTTIWSTGLAWNLHNESFFKNHPGFHWLTSLRLRGSIGTPGNQNFSDYISTRVYRYNNDNRNPFGPSVIVANHGNPSLKWQKTLDRNIGLDLQTAKNRLRLNADYFVKTTDPLLVFVTVPSSSGAVSVTDNLGGQEQKGFTISANYALIQHKSLTWMLNLNARRLKSKYKNFGNALSSFNEKNKGVNMTRYYDGASPSDLWAVRSLGIDPATGREIFLNREGNQTFVHDYRDEVVVGNSDPDLEGIVGTSVSYKGFSANLALRYRLGGQVFMHTLYEKVENITFAELGLNQDRRALTERWQKPGDNAKFRSIKDVQSNPMSSRFVEDNNILAGESISIGYENTTAKWVKALGASAVSFRVYMNDIFRISTVLNERGIDYPFARSVSFSMGVRF